MVKTCKVDFFIIICVICFLAAVLLPSLYSIYTVYAIPLYTDSKNYQISLDAADLFLKLKSNSEESNSSFNKIINLSQNEGHSREPKLFAYRNYLYVTWLDDSLGNRDIFLRRSTDSGATFGKTINLSNHSGVSSDPQLIQLEDNVYVVWEHAPGNNGEIFFTRSTDNGVTFGEPINIANNTGFNGFPQLAASGNSVHLIWHDTGSGISLATSTDNGATFAEPVTLSKKDKISFHPQIAVDGNNGLYVVWITQSQGIKSKYDIVFRRSTDNGVTFSEPVTLSKKDKLSFHPQIAVDGNNSLYVIWYNGTRIEIPTFPSITLTDVMYIRSTDNGATFDKPIALTNYTGWSSRPQIAVSQDNNLNVVWQNNSQGKNGQIVFTRSIDNGATFDKPIVLSNKSTDSSYPQIAVSQDNNVSVVWQENATNNEVMLVTSASDDGVASEYNDEIVSFATNTEGNRQLINIAVVHPTFTDAAYDNSFYLFYRANKAGLDISDSNNTKYTNLLSSEVNKPLEWATKLSSAVVKHLESLNPKFNVTLLTDEVVHDNLSLFSRNGINKYDVVILGHQEYVTQQEYDHLKQFVSNGGLLILLDGNVFYAEVKYDKKSNTITLVKGHNWAFDGKYASKNIYERWANETSEWVGSNYCECYSDIIGFGNNPFDYVHNEEQYITNPNATIILDYNATVLKNSSIEKSPDNMTIATYELNYKKGKVITIGLIITDKEISSENRFSKFFDSLLLENFAKARAAAKYQK